MLTIRYINPTGMFSYGRSHNIDVEHKGLVNLVGVNDDKGGDSNGAGKSSLFNAMCEILYGENPTGVSGNEVANQVMDSGFAGRVEFCSWEGIYYRVTYCRAWKEDFYPVDTDNKVKYRGAKPSLFFDKFEDDQWKDARADSMKNTKELIVEALGITYGRFLSIAYLSHRIGSLFLRGTNADRMDIMAGITGVEEWDNILVNARAKKLSIQHESAAAQQKLSHEEGALAQLQIRLVQMESADYPAQLVTLGESLKKGVDSLASIEEIIIQKQEEVEGLSADLASAYERTGAGDLSQQISDLAVKESELRNPSFIDDSLPEFDPVHRQNVEYKRIELDRLRGTIRAVTGEADVWALEECPTCGSTITETMRKQVQSKVDKLEEENTALEGEWVSLVKLCNAEEEKVQKARQTKYNKRLKKADKLKDQVAELRVQLKNSTVEYERVGGLVNQVNADLQQAKVTRAQLGGAQASFTQQQADVKLRVDEVESLKNSIQVKEGLIAPLKANVDSDTEELAILGWVIQNVPYIKLHRMSVAMSHLSDKVNGYLSDMGDTVRVNITSFDEKKSTKGAGDVKDMLKSEVKVEVIDGEKNIDPRLYSDGETSKISNALIRALHELAMQGGHGCNLILLDEIFSFVDLNNSQRLAESFRDVGKGTTLVTDNSGYVNDLMEFAEVWVARKRNGMTLLEA